MMSHNTSISHHRHVRQQKIHNSGCNIVHEAGPGRSPTSSSCLAGRAAYKTRRRPPAVGRRIHR